MAKRRSYKRDRLGRFARSAGGFRSKGTSRRSKMIRNGIGAAAIVASAAVAAREVSAERRRATEDLWLESKWRSRP